MKTSDTGDPDEMCVAWADIVKDKPVNCRSIRLLTVAADGHLATVLVLREHEQGRHTAMLTLQDAGEVQAVIDKLQQSLTIHQTVRGCARPDA